MPRGAEPRTGVRSSIRRALALTLAVLVGAIAVTVVPAESASAVTVQWGTNGGTAPNYQTTVNGDFITVGNGVLACSGNALATGAGSCLNLHAAADNNANNVNDNFAMINNNSVAGFTTNSSTATLTVPSGATVSKAFLNWSANTGTYSGDARALCASYTAARGTATLPSGVATGYQTRAVQFQVGSGSITSFAPATMLEDATTQTTSRYYTGAADVTSAFSGVATGTAVNISAGNIWAPTGAGCYAGWSLTVVYDYGTYILGNNNSIPHRVIYYAGHVRLGQDDTPLSVNFTGFTAVAAGTRASFSLYEGDRNITGDTASYSRAGSATFTEIPNNAGATGNIGIGRADGSVRYTQTADTSTFTNQSVDVDTEPLTNVVAGDSTVTLKIGTSGDSYLLTSAVLSVPTAGIQVNKSYNGLVDAQYRTATEKATFTITLTNTGAGTLQNIQVTDDQADCTRALTGVTLIPLQSTTITCTATNVTTASFTSTAQATATTVVGGYLASGADSTQVVLSALSLIKTSALAPGATGRAGDVLTYTFTAKNTGGGPLTGVSITDPLVGLSALTYAWPGLAGTLTAGQSVVATATYTLKQTDVDAGAVSNTASTIGTDADGGVKPTATASLTTPITSAPALSITKTGTLAGGATGKVGDTINYAFSATNTGNVSLTGVTITDPHAGLTGLVYTWPAAANQLAPGQTVTATASYVIKQTDVDLGSVKNVATVTGTPPTGSPVSTSSTQVSVSTVAAAPGIATTKSGAYTSGTGAVGSVITYSFTAKNTGNVTLTGVAIADAHAGLSALSYTWPGTAGTLAPGQTVTATATYTVKQTDVDAGTITNTATGSGTPPTGAAVSSTTPVVTIAPAAAAPAITLTKSGAASGATVGSTVSYTFTLTNSGNVTLNNAGITDPLTGLSAITFGTWPSGTAGTLAPGQSVTATATYTLKQSDIDAGAVTNSATATAKPPTGANVTQVKSATVPIAPTGALTTTKAGTYTSGSGAVGSVIRWDITFRNAGNVTLSQVALSDSLSGLSTPVITWPGTAGTLAPGATATATATYTVTQADVDAGSVKNTATATGKTPQGATVTGPSPQASVTTAAASPGLSLVKSGAIAGGAAGNAGDVITYTFTLRNTGNVTLTGVTAADPLSGLGTLSYTWPTATAGTLAPGQTATATASYTIKQSDVDTGNVKNTATASGTTPSGGSATATSGQITTNTAAASPSIVTTKSGALANGATGVAGDVVTWTVTLRNSGNVTLNTVAAADSQTGISGLTYTWPGAAGTLAPGQTATATATYTLTQTDVDAGAVSNVATGSAKSPTNVSVSSTASATVPVVSRGALSLTKTPSVTSGAKAGDVITYTFVARNTGNVTLTGVTITDPLPGLGPIIPGAWPSGTTGKLLPNTQVTATATYTVKQTDVDAGFVKNTASVSGNPPTGVAAAATSGQVTVTTVAAAPSITTTKSAAYTTGSGAVGSVLTYTFTAKNTGNVTLTAVSIADPHPGLSALTYTWPATAGTLLPNATVTATATYALTQTDVDAGSVTNQATGTGTPPTGAAVTGKSAIVTTSTAASAPAITLTKTGSVAGATAGSTVTYTFVLKNTGNVTLTGAGITDPLPGLSASPIPIASWPSGTAGTLRVGDQVTGTATYQLTQTDIDAGAVSNTSTASATPPTGAAVTKTASATVPIVPTGALTVTKSGTYTSGSGAVGSVIRWDITVKNTGNVSLSQVALSDTLSGLSTPVITWPATAGTLAPGATATATATYTVTQADVDAGSVKNTATATGTTPKGAAVTGSSPQASVATAIAAPAMSLVKTGVIAGGAAGNAGDVITYTFTLKNTGNVTLTGVTASDPLAGLSALTYTWPGTAGTLAPNQTATATASYTIKQSDVDLGNVKNTASASGNSLTGGGATASSGQVTTNTAAPAPATATTKSGVLAAGSTGAAGDTVNWSFSIRNSGNVTLNTVGITDSLPGISALVYTWPGSAGSLAPGQTATATATYLLTQTDVDAGAVSNVATGAGKSPTGVSAPASTSAATVTVTPRSSLSVTKTPSVTSGARAGDVVTYTFVVRNTGNVSLSNVTVTDPLAGLSAITPATTAKLNPGQQVTATATYTVKQTDVDAGFVKNTAGAAGTPPTGAVVTASSGQVTVTTVAASPAITTTKSAAYTTGSGAVGSVITYTFTAKNTGNVTLTAVAISDPHAGLSVPSYAWPGAAGTLAPNQTVTATATYTVKQSDVDAGTITNQATGTGTPPTGAAVTSTSAIVTTNTAPAAPAITLTKTGSAAGATAGSTVTYTFVLKNTGNVTLTGAGITDPLPGLSASPIPIASWPSGTAGTLRVGDQVTGTATYQLTQTDIDAGAVSNTSTASATPPTGAAVTKTASATVPIVPTGALTVTKSGTYTSGSGAVGSVIRWDITVKNTGNVSLSQVALSDTLSGLSTPVITWPATAGTLAPNATATATANYTVTQADVDLGSVKNTASSTARTPAGATVTATSPQASVTTSTAVPGLSLVKTGVIAGGAAGNAGDVITYTFTLKNTGNVTLTGVSASDPLAGLSAVTYTWPGAAGVLAPNQTATGTASYTIKQGDVDLGNVKNTASASGTTPTNGTTSATSGQVTTNTAAAAPATITTKSGVLATGSTGAAGDTVNWSFSIRNSGNVTLNTVGITDSLPGISALVYTWPGSAGSLAPGQTATATATYLLTQTDVDAGAVSNVATGAGKSPTGVSAPASTSAATVTVTPRSSLSVTKTPSVTSGARAGDVVTYTFVVRNTGNVSLSNVTVTDPLAGLSAITPATTAKLNPGQQVTATATYTVKQTDVDAGFVKNTAGAAGTPPTGAVVTASSGQVTVTTVAASPAITTTKSAAYTTGSGAVGSVITYTFTAKNTGNVTLTGVTITDPLANLSAINYNAWVSGTTGKLLPGQTETATATYTVVQTDVDRGAVNNTATSTGTPPTGANVTSTASANTATVASAPAVSLTKSGVAAGTTAGSTVTYTFVLKNTGNVTLTSAAITDPLPGLSSSPIPIASWPSGTVGTLRVGDQVTGTASYTLKQSDVDAGAVSNTATATATPPTGAAVTRAASSTVPIASAGALTLSKSAAYTSGSGAVGSVITYTFTAKNTGNVTLSGVTIADPLTGLGTIGYGSWPSGTTGTLRVGDQIVGTAAYTVTQTDVNRGNVVNTASVAGNNPTGGAVTASSPTVTTTTATRAPAITTAKSAAVSGTRSVGDTITYTITATNSGNVTLTGVTVSDPMFTQAQLSYGTWTSGTTGTLQPGQSISATGTRVIIQTDVDAGSVINTASSSGTPPTGAPVSSSSPTVTTTLVTRVPTISLTQTGALPSGSTGKAGDTVTWTFTIKNTGNVTLTGVTVAPGLTGISAIAYGAFPSGTTGTLAPGQSVTATATSTLTQSQVDAGSVTDPATASGTGAGSTPTASTPATVTFTPVSSISLTKSGAITSGAGLVGSVITYTFVAKNTGATTLTGTTFNDPHPGLSSITPGAYPSGTPGTLRPGDSVTATATYTLAQADVDAGNVKNTASVAAKNPQNANVTGSSDQVTVATGVGTPALSLTKTATPGSGAVGSVTTYTFVAKNTGQVTLTGVAISDPLVTGISYTWPVPAAPGVLTPGQSVTATATYTLIQADVDRGYVDNRATVVGSPPTGAAISAQSALVHTLTAAAAPKLDFTKTGSVTSGGGTAGSVIGFSFTIKNSGNVTLTGVAIAEQLAGIGTISFGTWPSGTTGTLAPTQTVTATANYTATQSDVDAGSVVNTATVSGTPSAGGAATTTPASATVPLTTTSGITLTKSSSITTGSGGVGSTVTYTFVAKNTGAVSLKNVTITDPLSGLGTIGYGTWTSGTTGTLLPNGQVTATATYTVTQADVDRGSIANTATVNAKLPNGTAVTPVTSNTVTTSTVTRTGALSVGKSASITSGARVGDIVRYTITATNTGNTTLTGVTVTDPLTGLTGFTVTFPGATGVLAPNAAATATGNYQVTQADVDGGSVVNTATANGTSPLGATAPASGSATTNTQTRAPAIAVTDSGALAAGSTGRAGDIVTFTYVITNSGNTTLTGVGVTETLSTTAAPSFGGSPTVTLAPGQSATATASHVLTQVEVDAGRVTSNVTATGTPPAGAGGAVTSTATATVPITAAPDYTVVKSAAFLNGGTGAQGDTIRYTLTVKNTGNVTLYRAQLVDPLPGLGSQNPTWPDPAQPGVIAPGQTAIGYADYVIPQSKVDLGYVDNTAHVAFFTSPVIGGGTEIDRDSNAVRVNTVQATPRLTTTKSGVVSGSAGVGSTISWTVVVTNSGNVTVTGITIAEQLTLTNPSTVWQGGVTGTLAPGATATLTGTTAIGQPEVDAGAVVNTASASGASSRDAATVTSNTAAATVRTQTSAASVHQTKTAAPASGFTGKAGDLVTFSYSLTNTGNVSLSSVGMTESLSTTGPIVYTWTGTPGTLAVGATVTGTAQHRLTQAEVDAGGITSPVTGVGTPAAGAAVVSDTASAGISVTPTPSMAVTKSGVTGGTGAVGNHIAYTFTITNTGNVTLSLVDLIDSLAGVSTPVVTWPNPSKPGVVGPGEVATATSDYVITQTDVDSGNVKNTATASGKPPVGDTIFASSPLTTTTVAPEAPALTVVKTSNPSSGLHVGDTIRYTITATNSGNVTVSGITASDPHTGISALTPTWPGPAGSLAPGQNVAYAASYQVTQSDIDAGSVVNAATVSGTTGKGTAVSGSGSVTTPAAAATRSIAITDSGALAAGAAGAAGDTVVWTYLITNTGTVTLTGITAAEAQINATAPVFGTWPGATGTLAPGQSVSASSSYVLTQADVDAGSVAGAASTRGTTPAPGSTTVTANATASVPIAARPDYSVQKSAAFLDGGTGAVGDTVRYTLTVPNTGNVTLYRAQLVDPLPGLGPQHPTWPDASKPGVIAPGQTATGYADYVLTQADVDLGHIDNTAHVAFFTTPTTGGTEIDRNSNTVRVVTAQAAPQLTVTKSGAASGTAGVGSTISWTVVVTNSGNVAVSGIQIAEQLALTGASTVWQGGVTGTLAPTKTATLTGTTTIQQTDVDAGSVANTASASGLSIRDAAPVTSNTASATVRTQNSAAAVHVTKTAAPASGFTGKAGDLVTFSYSLTNTGNVSLSGVSLSESLSTTGAIAYTWPTATPGVLAVGATVTGTAQHRLTQAEVDAGGITSPVTGVGTPPAGAAQVSDTASAGITVISAPSMAVTKSGVTGGTGAVGNHIAYAFTITNTGNVTLSLVKLIDSLAGVSTPVVTWPDASKPGVVAPGQVATATSDYVITQTDVDSGSVKNTATASGKPPIGDTVFASSPLTTTTVQAQAPALTVTKSATPTSGLRVGDTIQYSITAINTGNVSIGSVVATDGLTGVGALTPTWSGVAGTLAPGQNVVYTTSYLVKQSDVDAGSVVNSATVSGSTTQGTAVSGTGTVTSTAATTAAQLSITDTGALAAGATGAAGDSVIWSYLITNSGGVTLTGVTAGEGQANATAPVFGTWPGTVGTLSPGQSVTATSTYLLTQADVDRGSVASAASTRGTGPAPGSATVTANATATVPLTARPDYTVVKSAALLNGGTGAVGDTIRYTLNVKNTGNVTLYRAKLVDPLVGLGPENPTWPDPTKPGVVAPGQTATGYADYPITQADVNLGHIDNVAHVGFFTTPTPTPGETEIDRDSNAVRVNTVQAVPRLVVTKSGVAGGTGAVGDTITWTVRVANTGNVTITGITITDDLALQGITTVFGGGVAGTLAPNGVATLTGTTTITQTDVDAGSVANTAHSSGISARDNSVVVGNDAPATVRTIGTTPSIGVTKSATRGTGWTNRVGDIVDFSYSVTNTGNTTLTGVALIEALTTVAGLTYTWPDPANPGKLLPGQTATATAGYAITQADVDRGSESSAVTAGGTPASGAARVTASATAGVTIDAAPTMAVTKTGVVATTGAVGTTIDYSFTITNTGNVTLTLVDLLDSLAGVSAPNITWPRIAQPGVLLPTEQATATATYTITQADVDRGSVANTATASGKPPVGDKITQTSNASNTTVAAENAKLTVTKTAVPTSNARLNTVVGYTIQVTNSGNVTLTGVAVTDALAGLTGFTVVWPGTAGTLAPGQVAKATPSYRVTQADVDAGHVDNTAAASGTSIRGTTASDQATATTQVVTPASPTISVTDAGALNAGASGRVGDTVTWSYTITNTGDVTLHGITAAEAQTNATAPVITWPGATGVLAPGQSAPATATYVLTQADVDSGSVVSHVSTSGISPTAVSVNGTATASVPIAAHPSFTVIKGGSIMNGGQGDVGDTIRYTLSGVNTGNVTLYRGNLIDPLPGLGDQHITWPTGTPGIHPPGTTVSGYADYVLTQADIDRGYIDNVATIREYTTPTAQPGETGVTVASNLVHIVTEQATPQLTVVKSSTVSGTGGVGDTVSYTVVTSNTGDVTITGITVSDPLLGAGGLATTWPGATGTLAPGGQATSTGSYVLTQADIDRGAVLNTATASGSSARDAARVTGTSNQLTTPTVTRSPSITVSDSGALATPADAKVGGTVNWSYRITNTGNVTLSGTGLSDALVGVGTPVYTWPGAAGVLAPGTFVNVTATYTLTQADVDAGSVISMVSAHGTPPTGADATATDMATVLVQAAPAFTVTKTGALLVAGRNGVGDTVVFSFVLGNPGNVTLHGVTLTDSLAGLAAPTFTWPTATAGVLPPGTSATATARYQFSQADVDAGSVSNQASATATPPTGAVIPAQSTVARVNTVAPVRALSVVKGGALTSGTGSAGSVVRFTFAIKNTGNVTVSGIALSDALTGLGTPVLTFPGGVTTLTPGASATGYADYTLTQADVDLGHVDNTATANGTAPGNVAVTATSNAYRFTTSPARPSIVTAQTGALAAGQTGTTGDTINYVFTATNTGNVTLTAVTLAGTVGGLINPVYVWPGTPGVLAPGQSVTLRADHLVTQAEVDAAVVRNVESSSGTPPTGAAVSNAADELVIPLATSTGLALSKSGVIAAPGTGAVGDLVNYSFDLTNTGTQTLTGAAIADGLPGVSTISYGAWPHPTSGTLEPGDVEHATATYRLTQADVDRGRVTNTATGSALDPTNARVSTSSPASVVTVAAAVPAIAIAKTAALAGSGTPRVGDLVNYTFDVSNPGNVTLTVVGLGDDQPGISPLNVTWPGTPGILAPGQHATATATYALTQADIDAGSISSTASTQGTGVRGGTVTGTRAVTVTIAASPSLTIHKTASSQGTPALGTTVIYSFVVTNTGNVSLSGVDITDSLLAPGAISYTWPGANGVLAPGQSAQATAGYTVTQLDVDAGAVDNTATAAGIPPVGAAVSAQDSAVVAVPNGAAILLTVTVELAPGEAGFAGDHLIYRYTVKNTGNRAVSDTSITDAKAGLGPIVFGAWPGIVGVLQPGQSVAATATYLIQPADEGTLVTNDPTARATGASASQIVTSQAAADIQLPTRAIIDPGGLARTGSDPTLPGTVALLLLLWGLVLFGAGRRRRKENA